MRRFIWSQDRESDPRPPPYHGGALPTELSWPVAFTSPLRRDRNRTGKHGKLISELARAVMSGANKCPGLSWHVCF